MKKLLLFLFSFGLLISTSVTAEIVLYCNAELATGLMKKNGIYGIGSFKLNRYTIKFSDDYSEVKGLDSFEAAWQCKDTYHTKEYNTVVCNSVYDDGASFTYHKNTKRYVHFDGAPFGFIDNGNDTNAIIAGTCQKF